MPKVLSLPSSRACAIVWLALAAGCYSGAGEETERPRSPPVAGYVTLTTETVPLTIVLPGRTAAIESSEVRPQVSGVVEARLFTEGSLVKRGQTLYRIDPSLFEAAAAEARATLQNARAVHTAATARADRFRPLAKIQAVSAQDLTDAEAQASQAAAQIASARASLQTAQINLRFTRVPAPISGRIGRSLVTTGALVTANQAQPMAQIQRLDPIFVDVQQSSADLLALRRAVARDGTVPSTAPVRLRLEDGSDYGETGRLEFSEPVVDPTTGTVTLRARFPNSRGLLLPGMYVRAELAQAAATDAVLVPQAALSRTPTGGATVLLVGPGEKAVERVVEADRTVGDRWLVRSGVGAGDRVIVEGLGRIKPGDAIRAVPAGAPKPVSAGDAAPAQAG